MNRAIITTLLLLLPSKAIAADWNPEGFLPTGLKLTGALIIILGLILLLYYVSRKGFCFLPTSKTGVIKLIETRHLMPKKTICLVEVRGKEFLLGLGTDRIELISQLEPPNKRSFEETLCSTIKEE